MKKIARRVSLISSLMMMTMLTVGQAQRRGQRGPQVVSHEVSTGGKVVFRLLAPQDKSVQLVSPDLDIPGRRSESISPVFSQS